MEQIDIHKCSSGQQNTSLMFLIEMKRLAPIEQILIQSQAAQDFIRFMIADFKDTQFDFLTLLAFQIEFDIQNLYSGFFSLRFKHFSHKDSPFLIFFHTFIIRMSNTTHRQMELLSEQAYDLSHRFRNLQDPLRFIENDKILGLRGGYQKLKSDMKKQQDSVAEFSKSIYKKVISRDSEYDFKHDLYGNEFDLSQMFNNKYSKTGQIQKTQERVKKEDLERRFKHGEITSLEEKRERMREEKEIPLTFKHVKMIDTPEFDDLRDVEFYSLIRGEADEKNYSHAGSSNEIESVNVLAYLDNFKHRLIEYTGKHSYNFLFNCDRELMFWKLQVSFREASKSQDEVLATCAFLDTFNISIFDFFDFASANVEMDDVIKFYKLKKALLAKMQMDKNNESLEEKYNEAKRRFEEMKENRLKSKNQRLPAKFISSVAQTNDEMKEKDFEEYFVQDAKNIFNRLKQLNDIRDRIIEEEEGETFNVMATNIGLEIGKEIFKLLLLVLKGQEFSNYSQFVKAQNEQQVERKILQLIYLEFSNFKEYDVNGISKVDIIRKYLEEREKNERFYETFIFKHPEPTNNKSIPTRQTPTKQTPTKQTPTKQIPTKGSNKK